MMWRLLCAGVLVAVVGAILGEIGFRGKRAIVGMAIVLFALAVIDGAGDAISSVMGLADMAGITDGARCAMKVIGAGYCFGICADVADELGERGICAAVTNAGRIEIFLIIFPYFKEILDIGLGLLK